MVAEDLLQLKTIKFAKKYYSKSLQSGQDLNTSAKFYMPAFGHSQGHFKIRKKTLRNFLLGLIFSIRDLFLISTLSNFKIVNSNNTNKGNYKRIIVSWAKKDDFSEIGIFNDRYLGLNSKDTNTLWFLLYLDKKIPKKIKKNIILVFQEKKFVNIIFLIKYLLLLIKKNFFNLRNVLNGLSTFTCFALIVNNFFLNVIKNIKFKKIIIPFESQPFQNLLISSTKKHNKKIKLIGY